MPDRVVDAIARASCRYKSFVADEEVQVLGATLPRQMPSRTGSTSQECRLVRDGWAAGARSAATACWALRSYCGWEDEGWGVVTGETWTMAVITSWWVQYEGLAYQASSIPYRYMPASVLNRITGARRQLRSLLVHDNGGGLGRHICSCLRNKLTCKAAQLYPRMAGKG